MEIYCFQSSFYCCVPFSIYRCRISTAFESNLIVMLWVTAHITNAFIADKHTQYMIKCDAQVATGHTPVRDFVRNCQNVMNFNQVSIQHAARSPSGKTSFGESWIFQLSYIKVKISLAAHEKRKKKKRKRNTRNTTWIQKLHWEIQTKATEKTEDEKISKDIRNTENYCHYVDKMCANKGRSSADCRPQREREPPHWCRTSCWTES